ncbi:uncharacterized protein MCAP_0864-like [Ptychodera flava]|uniref:uncharacterized protein MCAP_0864-like n=1 Tax=Ptychodera flava TaxID=63121 RepID=UPI00396A3249
MSDYMNYQQLTLKLASISAEKDSLLHRQPKLKNLTALLEEERLETRRNKERADLLERELELAKRKLVLLKEQQRRTKKDTSDYVSDDESVNEKKLIGRTEESSSFSTSVVPGISHEVLENLVRELAICKRELKKFLNGQDMRSFLESTEYEETVKELQESVKEKTKEIEDLRAEIKQRDLDSSENDDKTRQQMKEQIVGLTKSVGVKTVLVNVLTQELEKLEKKCSEEQERYNKEIEALREEKNLVSKHKIGSGPTAEETALKAELHRADQEIAGLLSKFNIFRSELINKNEELEVKSKEIVRLEKENQDLLQRITELETKPQNCLTCVDLSKENEELKSDAAQHKEYVNLMTTQMKCYEDDFQHERKDREDMKSKYDRDIEEKQSQITGLTEELYRIKNLYQKERKEREQLQRRQMQQYGYGVNQDLVTDMVSPGVVQSGHRSYAYGQQARWQHKPLPTEVVVDSDIVVKGSDEVASSSLTSHGPRECPRCEREFAPHERDEFEKHVEKCLN